MSYWKRLFGRKTKQASIHIRPDRPVPKMSDDQIVARENDLLEAVLLDDTMGLPKKQDGSFLFPPSRKPSAFHSGHSVNVFRQLTGERLENVLPHRGEAPGTLDPNAWSSAREAVRNSNCFALSLTEDPKTILPCILHGNHEGPHERIDGLPWKAGAAPKTILVHKDVVGEITGPEDLERIKDTFQTRRNNLAREEKRTLTKLTALIKEHFPETAK